MSKGNGFLGPGSTPAMDRPKVAKSGKSDRLLTLHAVVVLANYLAQIPYAVDLYGLRVSLMGATLLLATLAWFLLGLTLVVRRVRLGTVVLLVYSVAQVAFYTATEVLGTLHGAGLPYQLLHARDAIVWMTFVVGDLNFVFAVIWLAAFVWSRLRRSDSDGSGSGDTPAP